MATEVVTEASPFAEYGLMLVELLILTIISSMAYFIKQVNNRVMSDIDSIGKEVQLLSRRVTTLEEKGPALKEDITELQNDIRVIRTQITDNQKELTNRIVSNSTKTSEELNRIQLQLGKILGYLEGKGA